MTPLPSPEAAKGWLNTLLAVTDRATSVTLLFILLMGTVMGYYGLQELKRVRVMNVTIWEKLVQSEREKLAQAQVYSKELRAVFESCARQRGGLER